MERIVNNGVRRKVKLRIIPDSFAYPYSNEDDSGSSFAPRSLLGQKISGNELSLNNQPVRGVPGRITGNQGDSFKTRIF